MIDIELLKFPIGRFSAPKNINSDQVSESIEYLTNFPTYLDQTVTRITLSEQETPYRPGR
jgi:hypothetical protein